KIIAEETREEEASKPMPPDRRTTRPRKSEITAEFIQSGKKTNVTEETHQETALGNPQEINLKESIARSAKTRLLAKQGSLKTALKRPSVC
ncbi:hypothetical protein J6590_056947, partial [Homalodisca vitripennis]